MYMSSFNKIGKLASAGIRIAVSAYRIGHTDPIAASGIHIVWAVHRTTDTSVAVLQQRKQTASSYKRPLR